MLAICLKKTAKLVCKKLAAQNGGRGGGGAGPQSGGMLVCQISANLCCAFLVENGRQNGYLTEFSTYTSEWRGKVPSSRNDTCVST